jgi:hypothetical protein
MGGYGGSVGNATGFCSHSLASHSHSDSALSTQLNVSRNEVIEDMYSRRRLEPRIEAKNKSGSVR